MILLNNKQSDFESVYNHYADILYRVALAKLCSAADAEDVVQDVFLKYMAKPPVFFSESHEKAWFIRVTINRCCDIIRRRSYQPSLNLDDITEIAAEDEGYISDLLDKLSRLPDKYRETVTLHCLEGFSLGETAGILGISLSATKMRLSRAREMLRENKD